jgi:hypothetical protein
VPSMQKERCKSHQNLSFRMEEEEETKKREEGVFKAACNGQGST